MEFRNHTCYPAMAFDALDQFNQGFHVAVMRTSFDIQGDGALTFSSEQEPLVAEDRFSGEPNASSVLQESDLAPYKPRCDIIVNAIAHAPGGRPARGFLAGIRITSSDPGKPLLDKRLIVTGPREWKKSFFFGWSLSEPQPIRSLPLRYEHAYGGECRIEAADKAAEEVHRAHWLSEAARRSHPQGYEKAPIAQSVFEANPIGRGHAEPWYLSAKGIKRIAAPQIGSAAEPIFEFKKRYTVQGLGVIGRGWQPRRQLAGSMDEAFIQDKSRDLPEDFDFGYWNGAHPEMQIAYPKGDETIELINLVAPAFAGNTTDGKGNTRTRIRLPDHRPFVLVRFEEGNISLLNFNLDTVYIDTGRMTVSLVHRVLVAQEPAVRVLEARCQSAEQKRELKEVLARVSRKKSEAGR